MPQLTKNKIISLTLAGLMSLILGITGVVRAFDNFEDRVNNNSLLIENCELTVKANTEVYKTITNIQNDISNLDKDKADAIDVEKLNINYENILNAIEKIEKKL